MNKENKNYAAASEVTAYIQIMYHASHLSYLEFTKFLGRYRLRIDRERLHGGEEILSAWQRI